MVVMDVELLIVTDCPHEDAAAGLLRKALDDVGMAEVDFGVRVIRNAEQAAAARFVGSPAFHLNGRDPFSGPDAQPAVACRLYATPAGLRGLPDAEALREALRTAAGATAQTGDLRPL